MFAFFHYRMMLLYNRHPRRLPKAAMIAHAITLLLIWACIAILGYHVWQLFWGSAVFSVYHLWLTLSLNLLIALCLIIHRVAINFLNQVIFLNGIGYIYNL